MLKETPEERLKRLRERYAERHFREWLDSLEEAPDNVVELPASPRQKA